MPPSVIIGGQIIEEANRTLEKISTLNGNEASALLLITVRL